MPLGMLIMEQDLEIQEMDQMVVQEAVQEASKVQEVQEVVQEVIQERVQVESWWRSKRTKRVG